MKYLEGSSFSVHVGGSAYSEGWDRIFSRKEPSASLTVAPHGSRCACRDCAWERGFITDASVGADASSGVAAQETSTVVHVGCFDCERIHAIGRRCHCMCHALDDRRVAEGTP